MLVARKQKSFVFLCLLLNRTIRYDQIGSDQIRSDLIQIDQETTIAMVMLMQVATTLLGPRLSIRTVQDCFTHCITCLCTGCSFELNDIIGWSVYSQSGVNTASVLRVQVDPVK